ncbi:MAG: insulinase family protein [Steroidobacteraceae bacterium]
MNTWLKTRRNLVTLALVATFSASQGAQAAPYKAQWPQKSSDLQADPAVTFGTLPNGMRYAIMKNNTPANALSMRLLIDAGSIQESDAQQGIAHLLEHMAFRGSKNMADGEVNKTLERLGLRFGADTNAMTNENLTVYQFDLPKSDDTSVDTGLMLLREIASELSITDAALATERGVVLSEQRLRDGAALRAAQSTMKVALPTQRVADRLPGGKPEVIANADAKLVRSYYNAYYQPQRATLVVVGNIDSATLVKKISTKFGSWKAGKTPDDPDLGTPKQQGMLTHIYTDASLPTEISSSWIKPYDSSSASVARHRQNTLDNIGLSILNERLAKLAQGKDAPYTAARVSKNSVFRSAEVTDLTVTTTPEKWRTAWREAHGVFNVTLQQGVTQAELDRAINNIRNNNKVAVERADTRSTPALAALLVAATTNNKVFNSPQYVQQINEKALQGATVKVVAQALRDLFSGSGPIIAMIGDKSVAGSEAMLASTYNDSSNYLADATQFTTNQELIWPYTNFGTPGKVASTIKSAEEKTTFVRFENGVVLGVRKTDFAKGEVQVLMKVGNGLLAMDKNRPIPSMFSGVTVQGGLEKIDALNIRKVMTGKTASVNLVSTDGDLLLLGKTNASDINTQLQYLTAFLIEPGFNSNAIEQARNSFSAMLPQLQAQPLSYLQIILPWYLHNQDPRWAPPSLDSLKAMQVQDLRAWLEPQLLRGAVQINIVGDINENQAIQAAAKTVGAIDNRPIPTVRMLPASTFSFPAATQSPVALIHTGNADQAGVALAWPMPVGRGNRSELAALNMLSAVLKNRLLESIRSSSGTGYNAIAALGASPNVTDYGYMLVASVVKPEQAQGLFNTINGIADDLRNTPVSADELQRAVAPTIATLQKMFQSNILLASVVSPEIDQENAEDFGTQIERVQAVTPEQIQQVARKYLIQDKVWQAVMMPQTGAAASK